MNLLVFFYFSVVDESLMDRQVFNWTQTIFVACVLGYCHFVIVLISAIWTQTQKMRKWRYLSPETTNLKNKGTFFSSTFKVEEKKVPSDFFLEAI